MKKTILLLLTFIFCISCERKTEFIQSNVYPSLFLLKDPPKDDSLIKKEIILFLIKNPSKIKKREYYIDFYKYTSNTKYFLENEEYDGFRAQVLSMYNKDLIASFSLSHCKTDSTKWVGKLRLYNDWGDHFKPDTIIYKCN